MSSEDQEKLIAYLENSGNLYIEGSNVAYDHQGTTFLTYLGVDFINMGTQNAISSIQGVSNSITESLEFTYSYGSDADYNVDVIAGENEIFSSQDEQVRAVIHQNRAFRTVCAAPILGAYYDGEGNNTKAHLVGIYLDYFGENETQIDPNILNPAIYLSQNYPNPFNPQTTIHYYLGQDDFVEMTIYNLKGQKIKTLVQTNQKAGAHYVTWQGFDDYGKAVGNGTYFYRLTTTEKQITHKMLLLK